MQVSYQHANPQNGRESFLVRFHDAIRDQKTCILVDAGDGVDVDDLLREDEYLSAILLTHAHLDHYRSLGSNLRDGAPVYASAETTNAIITRLDTDAEHANLDNPDDVRAAIEPISNWTTVTSDVRVHPVPAGHAPGACGFVVQFADGNDHHHLLATGDFTVRRAADFPGLQTDLPVDAVFLTAATRPDFRRQLTNAVATAVKRATAGSTVLTTASGLNGVQLAHLLSHVGSTDGWQIPITVTGHVATLWDAFEYGDPAVESVPAFGDPDGILDRGRITIAGPEVPVAGSSEQLFDAIADDAGATLLQVTSGAFDPVESAACTVVDYELSNHPNEDTIDAVVEELAPIHVVVMHQQGDAADRYKDKYDSFVWATDDEELYTLYDDGWSGPPWVTDATRRRVRSRLYRDGEPDVGSAIDAGDIPLPAVERKDDVDLEAEGIDTGRLADELGVVVEAFETSPDEDVEAGDDDGVLVADGSSEPRPVESVDPVAWSDDEERLEETITPCNPPDTGAVRELRSRLDRIEDAVTGIRTNATVVDAGSDVTLLRLADDSLRDELTHGQAVQLAIFPGMDREETGQSDSPGDETGDAER
jgi:putative mRNA 3-end processing factor